MKTWSADPPAWIEICIVGSTAGERLMALDPGERAAILLALERGADVLLMDDAEGIELLEFRQTRANPY